jgi:tetratricopeptide (TPR) repeat protein
LELGNLLREKRPGEAVGFYRAALALRECKPVYNNLGAALVIEGQAGEAIAACRRAIELDPRYPYPHYNLGLALHGQGRVEEAIVAYRRATELDPRYAVSHYSLGVALQGKGRLEEAIAAYRRAAELDPKLAAAHNNLGTALQGQGRVGEAIAAYRRAIELDPKNARAHCNLGGLLGAQGQMGEAIAAFRRAIELDPRYVAPHYSLGVALQRQGRLEEAITAFRRATELDPKQAIHHAALGQTLLNQGRFAEARPAMQHCHSLLPDSDPLRKQAQQLLGECERLLALEARLPALLLGTLEGKRKPPDAAELRELAALCQLSKRYFAAVGFYAAAFAARPRLADDLGTQDRCHAACAAALAAAGHGADAQKLEDAERARLRRQALDWLTADLAAWARLIQDNPRERARAHQALRRWQTDGDLAGLRDAGGVAQLPPDEQNAWRKLWAEVDALLRKSGPGK